MKQALSRNEDVIRLACIVGACACVVYGIKNGVSKRRISNGDGPIRCVAHFGSISSF